MEHYQVNLLNIWLIRVDTVYAYSIHYLKQSWKLIHII